MKKRIRIQGALIFLAAVIFVFFSRYIMPHWRYEPLDELFDMLGLGTLYFGFLLRIVSRGYKEDMTQGGNRLVTGGPYSMVRNPMYLGTLFIGAGVVMILFKFWAFLVFLAVYLVIYVPQSKKEEKVLEEKFGEEYLRYRSATPKYLPRLSGLFKFEDHLSCLKLSWVKKEAPSLAVTIVIIFVAEIFSDRMLFGSQESIDELAELSLGLVAFIIATMIIVTKKQNRHKR